MDVIIFPRRVICFLPFLYPPISSATYQNRPKTATTSSTQNRYPAAEGRCHAIRAAPSPPSDLHMHFFESDEKRPVKLLIRPRSTEIRCSASRSPRTILRCQTSPSDLLRIADRRIRNGARGGRRRSASTNRNAFIPICMGYVLCLSAKNSATGSPTS